MWLVKGGDDEGEEMMVEVPPRPAVDPGTLPGEMKCVRKHKREGDHDPTHVEVVDHRREGALVGMR